MFRGEWNVRLLKTFGITAVSAVALWFKAKHFDQADHSQAGIALPLRSSTRLRAAKRQNPNGSRLDGSRRLDSQVVHGIIGLPIGFAVARLKQSMVVCHGVSARPSTKELLHRLAEHLGVPEWRAVEIALLAYVESLPAKDRKALSPVSPDLVKCEYPAATAAAVRAFLRLWMEPDNSLEEAARTVIADQIGVPAPE